VLGPHRRPVEREHAAPLEDAVQDGLREVFVVEHAPPGRERLIGREDHGALLPVPIIDHVKEHVRGVGAVGEVPDFVDDEHARLEIRGQGLRESAASEGGRQVVDQFGGGDEARVKAILNRAVGEGDREMGLAAPGFRSSRPSTTSTSCTNRPSGSRCSAPPSPPSLSAKAAA
jgi:hypothetical protein